MKPKPCPSCKSSAWIRIVSSGWGGVDCCESVCEHKNEQWQPHGALWKCLYCDFNVCNIPTKTKADETLPCYIRHMLEKHPELCT